MTDPTQRMQKILDELHDYYNAVYNGIRPDDDAMNKQKALAELSKVVDEARIDELNRCTTNRIGDEWPEIRVNQEVPGGWVDVSKADRIATLAATARKRCTAVCWTQLKI